MKIFLAVFAVLILFALPLFANKKDQPTYDLTGIVSLDLPRYDSNADVTVNGKTYFAGCNVYETSVSCSDYTGAFLVKLADGRTMVLTDTAFIVGGMFPEREFGAWTVHSPLATNLLKGGKKSEAFQYRIASFKIVERKEDYLCVPTTTEDRHGKSVIGEACYRLVILPSATLKTYTQEDIERGARDNGMTPQTKP